MAATLVELAAASVARFRDRPLFGEREGDSWRWLSYSGWQHHVDEVRAGLASIGVKPGDRVAIVSRNSAAWAAAAYATYGLGAALVPMYEAQRPTDWQHILRDCGATVVFARTPAIASALEALELPGLRVITIEGSGDGTLAALEGAPPVGIYAASPEDLAGLIYTSGTTGLPKGVRLTQRNLTSNVEACVAGFPIGPLDRTVSFLPWAHVYGQVVELHILIHAGASTAFNTAPDKLLDDLRDVRPTILVAVPRIFTKLHAAVRAQIEQRPHAIQRLFYRGLAASIAQKRGEHVGFGDRVASKLAGVLFAAVRKKLGGRLRYAISGSATLSREIAEVIDGLGIEVYEGYGMTETSPIVTMNAPGHRKLGSVGRVIADVRVVIDETRGTAPGEGEIVVYGPNVMAGYHERPDETARAFTADGGLRTGDLGRMDADGYLFITGRIKEQYKLENGKYVMPTPLEERLALSPFVQAVMLHGSGRPFNVALVSVDAARIRGWAAENHVPLADDLASDERVRALIRDELEHASAEFRAYERPRDVVITEITFSVDNGLLTPTLKLKRRELVAMFGAALAALYPAQDVQHLAP